MLLGDAAAVEVLTGAAERLLGGDALATGGTKGGPGHRQGGEEVSVAIACLSLPDGVLLLSQTFSLFILEKTATVRTASTHKPLRSFRIWGRAASPWSAADTPLLPPIITNRKMLNTLNLLSSLTFPCQPNNSAVFTPSSGRINTLEK